MAIHIHSYPPEDWTHHGIYFGVSVARRRSDVFNHMRDLRASSRRFITIIMHDVIIHLFTNDMPFSVYLDKVSYKGCVASGVTPAPPPLARQHVQPRPCMYSVIILTRM